MGVNVKKIGPNRFFINVRVRRPGGEDRIRETFEGTKVEAEARYVQLRQQILESRALRTRFETFGDLLRFYEEKRGGFSYKDKCTISVLDKDLGEIPLPAFPARLEGYIAHLRRFPSKRTGKPYSNASINRTMTLIRAAFNTAVSVELLERNPITLARFPKLKEVPRDAALSPQAVRALLNVMEKQAPHLVPITRFALQVPCRKSELVKMRKEDLDLFSNAIRVRNGTTKNDMGIWKPIPPDMIGYFRSLPAECPYLFFRFKGGRYHPLGDFKKSWTTCRRLAGIGDYHWHDTRAQAATDLIDNGTPERVVMQIAGWKTDMLGRRYYNRDGKKALSLARFSPGVRTLAADTQGGAALQEATS
jgi:integrase